LYYLFSLTLQFSENRLSLHNDLWIPSVFSNNIMYPFLPPLIVSTAPLFFDSRAAPGTRLL
jgi:hypothetical protein